MADPITPNSTVTAPSPEIQPQSSPLNGQLTPPTPTPAPQQQPIPQAVPAKPGKTFHDMSHAFMGSVLGALAGAPEPSKYATDPETGEMSPSTPPDTTGSRLRRIARAALRGLAAGASVPPQKSGLAAGLAGAGAGAEAQQQAAQKDDLLKRGQAKDQFEQEQQAKLSKLTNEHASIELLRARGELAKSDIDSQTPFANNGADIVDAALAGGNPIMGTRDMDNAEVAKWINNPERMNYTPVLSKVEPTLDADGHVTSVNRRYTLVDLKNPIQVPQSMIDHLKMVNFPGADQLTAGQKVDPKEFQALYWQGLKLFNQESNNPSNTDMKAIQNPDGTQSWAFFNKVTKTTIPARDQSGQPVAATEKLEPRILSQDPISHKDYPDGAHLVYFTENGMPVQGKSYAGVTTASLNNDLMSQAKLGQYTDAKTGAELHGQSYLNTVPQPQRNIVNDIAHYRMNPQSFEVQRKGTNGESLMSAAIQANPGFNQAVYNARQKTLEDYTSGNGAFKTNQSINMALAHADQLYEAAKALDTENTQLINKWVQMIQTATGDPKVIDFNTAANAFSNEITRALKGGEATDVTIQGTRSTLMPWQSESQLVGHSGSIVDMIKLLAPRAQVQPDSFATAMGINDRADKDNGIGSYGVSILTPNAANVLTKILGADASPILQSAGMAAPQAQSSPQSGQITDLRAGPDGHQIGVLNGQWVDAQTKQPLPSKTQPQAAPAVKNMSLDETDDSEPEGKGEITKIEPRQPKQKTPPKEAPKDEPKPQYHEKAKHDAWVKSLETT